MYKEFQSYFSNDYFKGFIEFVIKLGVYKYKVLGSFFILVLLSVVCTSFS